MDSSPLKNETETNNAGVKSTTSPTPSCPATDKPNGNNESTTPSPVQKLDAHLDEYERKLGLPALVFEPDNEVHTYLKMNRQQLEKLTPDECGGAAYILRKYAFHLQRAHGRETARVKFLERQIRQILASEVGQYRGAAAEERREQAIRGNDAARQMSRQKDVHEARQARLENLSNFVSYMAMSLDGLQETKRRQRP